MAVTLSKSISVEHQIKRKLEKWITIKTFTLPGEVAILRGRLEAEGIECFLANELTIQVNPFFSNAVDGVQLQVKESDVARAISILKEGGYYTEPELKPPGLLLRLDKLTAKIPLLKKLDLLPRLMILVAMIISVPFAILGYSSLPTTYEKLTNHRWCLDYAVYKNRNYIPQTEDNIGLSIAGSDCEESITFNKNGEVMMPGFKSGIVSGHWQLEKNLLLISQIDTFGFIYNGTYRIDFTDIGLILKSEKTTLNCHAEHIPFDSPF